MLLILEYNSARADVSETHVQGELPDLAHEGRMGHHPSSRSIERDDMVNDTEHGHTSCYKQLVKLRKQLAETNKANDVLLTSTTDALKELDILSKQCHDGFKDLHDRLSSL